MDHMDNLVLGIITTLAVSAAVSVVWAASEIVVNHTSAVALFVAGVMAFLVVSYIVGYVLKELDMEWVR